MIVKPQDLNFVDKKISMIIAGVAGIGKTTLALSSPKPLLIDLDRGIDRVEVLYRKDTLFIDTFEELYKELKEVDLSEYETIVIDTGGKLFELLKGYVAKLSSGNIKTNGDLSLQGYGASKREFLKFVEFLRSLNKNIIYIFHATEQKLDNDMTGLRIRIEGSSRDEIWDSIDLGGFIEINNKNRTLCFSNNERFYAKGTHGIHGTFEIPLLEKGKANDFLTRLFNKYHDEIKRETEELKKYKKAIDSVNFDEKDINKIYNQIKTTKHALSSKEELWARLKEVATERGFNYDKEKDSWVSTDTKSNW